MPALSSTMTEGKIVEWLKQPGDKVARGESVLVVESDKADMDVESFNEGYLAAVLMPAGSTAPVGETIGLIVESEAEIAAAQAKAGGWSWRCSPGCCTSCSTSPRGGSRRLCSGRASSASTCSCTCCRAASHRVACRGGGWPDCGQPPGQEIGGPVGRGAHQGAGQWSEWPDSG